GRAFGRERRERPGEAGDERHGKQRRSEEKMPATEPSGPSRACLAQRRTAMNETRDIGNPVIEEVAGEPVASAVAVAGHPLHAMSVHFPIAFVIATLGCDLFYWW